MDNWSDPNDRFKPGYQSGEEKSEQESNEAAVNENTDTFGQPLGLYGEQPQMDEAQYGQGNPQYGQIDPQYGQGNPQYGQGNPQYGQGNPQYGQGNPQYGQDQGQYIQPPYGQQPYGQNPNGGNRRDIPMTEEEKKAANKWCLISTILLVAPKLISAIALRVSKYENVWNGFLEQNIDGGSGAISKLYTFLTGISGICTLASLILMIYVRVKYPKSTWGKVLMWIFIVGLIIMAVFMIILIIACASCWNELSHCPG